MTKMNVARFESLWGAFIGDALSMPVHWFYNPPDIRRLCDGWIKNFIPPPTTHPSCILTLSAVDSSGRTGENPKGTRVIGDVILHDKLKYWLQSDRTVHYHQGMNAGDNTLNSKCALEIIDTLSNEDPNHEKPLRELFTVVFQKYVKFLTTPGTHNDTYAESWHRAFFRDWASLKNPPVEGKELMDFIESRSEKMLKGPPDYQLAAIGCLTCVTPWIVHYAGVDENRATEAAVEFVKLTHPTKGMDSFVALFARSLHQVMNGQPLKQVAFAALKSEVLGFDSSRFDKYSKMISGKEKGSEPELRAYQEVASQIGLACGTTNGLTLVYFICYHFHEDFKSGILMNVNVGGDNCHRGSALGALLGAATAYENSSSIPEEFKVGLNAAASKWLRAQSNS